MALINVSSPTANEDAGTITFNLTLDQPFSSPLTFVYNTYFASANPNGAQTDYVGVSNDQEVVFAAGDTHESVEIDLINDKSPEPTETFRLGVQLKGSDKLFSGTATITDDDADPQQPLGDVSGNPLAVAAQLADAAYQDTPTAIEFGWRAVPTELIGLTSNGGDWTYADGIFEGDVEYFSGSQLFQQNAHLYEGNLNGVPTLALAFRGTAETDSTEEIAELIEQGAVGWSRLFNTYEDFLEKVTGYAEQGGFEQMLVTGHSLGGALAQKFFINDIAGTALADQSAIITFGSPGSNDEQPTSTLPILNVVHDDDLVPNQPFGERYGADLFVERPEKLFFSLVEHEREFYLDTAERFTAALEEFDLGADTLPELIGIAEEYTAALAPESGGGEAAPPATSFLSRSDIVIGGSGPDVLRGERLPLLERNADLIWGGEGGDTLAGGGGNDILDPGPGDDVVEGGFGEDIAIFAGSFADFEINDIGFLGRDQQVTDRRPDGDEGTDRLASVELIRFEDGMFNTQTNDFTSVTVASRSDPNDFPLA